MEDPGALEGMKRAQLQRLAKKAGIKANMKTGAIIQSLRKHYGVTGTMPSMEGTSCSEDNTTGDISAGSASESAGTSANEEQLDQTNCENTPPKKMTRRGRKGRKRAKASAKSTAEDESMTKTPEQKSASPAAVSTSPQPSAVAKTNTPKVQGPSGPSTSAVAVAELRPCRMTRSTTPKMNSVAPEIKITPTAGPDEPSGRRKTRSVTPSVTLMQQGPPVVDVPVPRRQTYEIEQDQEAGAQEVNNNKNGVEVDPAMKKAIMTELEQNAAEQVSLQSRIPKPKATSKPTKPITPGNKDWRRIHQAQFDKMESIEDYVARKRKRTETLSAFVKRAKMCADETRIAVQSLTSHRTPEGSAAKIAKPVRSRLRSSNLSFNSPKPSGSKMQVTKGRASVAALTGKAPASKSVTFKVSRLKTPTRAAVLLAGGAEPKPKRKSTPGPRKSVSVIDSSAKKPMLDFASRKSIGDSTGDRRKSIGVATPFKFGQTATTPAADNVNKAAFDLKASLGKPLTYKPHTGKLHPLEVSTRFPATSNIQKAKANILKKPSLKTRDDRRAGAKQNRANKRAGDVMARRRGISAM